MTTRRRPRVLYLAFYFPPTRASGVFRSTATANHLAAAGWDVTVHTAPREFFTDYIDSCDPSLEATVHPDVRVVRPGMSFAHWENDIRRFSRFRATLPTLDAVVRRKRTDLAFPEPYAPWIPRVIAHATAEHARRRYDLVLATGNPFASFAAAWMLHRALRIPYVLDYRDSWTFNQFTEELKYPPGHRAWAWEARVLGDAAQIAYVNQGMLDWHAERYPSAADRMVVVPNGWEPEQIPAPRPVDLPPPERPLRFGYVGTVTETMPIEELAEAWRLARQDPRMAGATLSIHGHLGFFPRQVDALRERLPLEPGSGVRFAGPVAKADIAGVYDELDVLLFWVPGARYVTSGKVFEYMATGKPVVSVHRPDIAAVDVLGGHPRWAPNRSLEPADIADAILRGADMARTGTHADALAARAHANRYTRSAVLSPFESGLREVAGA